MPQLENEFVRCAPDHPNRCQASGIGGQCPYLAKPGMQQCPRHAARQETVAAKAAVSMYQLQEYQARMEQFGTHDEIKNLRAEIGILRMVLEKTVNECHGNDKTLVAYAGKISDLVIKLRALVQSCHKLEVQLGSMLDRDTVMLIGQKIVDIISRRVENVEILDIIGEEIVTAIMSLSITQHEVATK